jgi:hypothetical protein
MPQIWVAIKPIRFGVFLAHTPGDVVPDTNVAKHKWDEKGLVAQMTIPDVSTPTTPGQPPRFLASSSIARIEYVTKAAYDALPVKDETTLYITY